MNCDLAGIGQRSFSRVDARRASPSWTSEARGMETDAPRILGDFKLKRELGRGGMGVVYLARQISLGRDVALKVLPPDANFEPARVLRFQREAALLGRISHPNIVKVFTVGETGDRHWLAMEFVDGVDLDRVLDARMMGTTDDTPDPFRADFVRAAVVVARDVSLALGAAHSAGIVHRDVKPSNILIEKSGRCVLADFGLARDVSMAALTRSQTAVGTPYFMSPERFRAGEPLPSADVWSVGALLYQCITRVRPFDADTPEELMRRILHEECVPPRKLDPTLPRDLETIVMHCLEKDPARRYRDGNELAADLDRYLRDEPVLAVPVNAITQAYRRIKRRQTSLLALCAVLLVACGFLTWGILERNTREAEREFEHKREAIQRAIGEDEIPKALELLEPFVAAHRERFDWRFEYADLLLRTRNWEKAKSVLESLLADGQRSATTGVALTRAFVNRSGYSTIDLSGEPIDGRDAFYRGLVYAANRNYESAEKLYELAVTTPPAPIEALYSLGAVRYRRGDFAGAEAALLSYDKVRSRAEVDMLLGQIEFGRDNYDAARSYFQRFARKQPTSVLAWNDLAAAHLGLASKAQRDGKLNVVLDNLDFAKEALEKARAIDSGFFLVNFNDACFSVLRGDIAGGEQRFEQALAGCANGDFWEEQMYQHFAGLLSDTKQHAKAVEYFEQAFVHRPGTELTVNALCAYAASMAEIGRASEAIALLDEKLAGPRAGNEVVLAKREEIAAKKGE